MPRFMHMNERGVVKTGESNQQREIDEQTRKLTGKQGKTESQACWHWDRPTKLQTEINCTINAESPPPSSVQPSPLLPLQNALACWARGEEQQGRVWALPMDLGRYLGESGADKKLFELHLCSCWADIESECICFLEIIQNPCAII